MNLVHLRLRRGEAIAEVFERSVAAAATAAGAPA